MTQGKLRIAIINMSYIFVGLGNKGEEYEHTRHNIGAEVLFAFAKKQKAEWKNDNTLFAMKTKVLIGEKNIQFLFPQTFMNLSGKTTSALKLNPKKLEELVVLHDDIDLPLGTFKIIFNRGSGGHKGVESINRSLKSEGYTRIRIGICPTTPTGKLKKPDMKANPDFIVSCFKKNEEEIVKKVIKKVGEAIEVIVNEGRVKAMNEFNK